MPGNYNFYPPPWPQQGRRYAPIPAQGDQPPKYSVAGMMQLVSMWQPGPPPIFPPVKIAPLIPIVITSDNPPPSSLVTFNSIIASWRPPLPQPFQRPITAPIPAQGNQPPRYSPVTLYSLIGSWVPPPPWPQQRLTTSPIASVSPPPPPPFVPNHRQPEAILTAWIPPPYYPPFHPPIHPPPTPTAKADKNFVNRVVGNDIDFRLRRNSELVSAIFNSLIRQEILVQIGPTDWIIDGAAITPAFGPTGIFTGTF